MGPEGIEIGRMFKVDYSRGEIDCVRTGERKGEEFVERIRKIVSSFFSRLMKKE